MPILKDFCRRVSPPRVSRFQYPPALPFNSASDAFELHPDILRSYGRLRSDEASQQTEVASLVALTRGARAVALVGDHKQLPPTVLSRDAEARGMKESLFDLLQSKGVAPVSSS